MHGSVHYQQGGAFPNVTNIPTDFAAAGERPAKAAGDLIATGINTYCGAHENSPRFTCAGCHVGNGRFPMAQSEFELLNPESAEAKKQLANIDCLMCHQDAYKRFPDWTANGYGFSDLTLLNMIDDGSGGLIESDGDELVRTGFAGIPDVDPVTGDFQFLPAGSDTLPAEVPMPPMTLTTLEAAQTVHRTTRKSCLNCHAGAAGANGAKRGDLSKENEAPSVAIDMHMSPAGADLTCADCHGETLPDGTGHRVRGRGLDLRPNDVPDRFSLREQRLPHGPSPRRLQLTDWFQQGQARPEGGLPDLPHSELRQGGRGHRGLARLAGPAPVGGGLQRTWRMAAAGGQGRPRQRQPDPELCLVRRHQRDLLPRRVAERCPDRSAGRERGGELRWRLQGR